VLVLGGLTERREADAPQQDLDNGSNESHRRTSLVFAGWFRPSSQTTRYQP
jgi:hypothetical protein